MPGIECEEALPQKWFQNCLNVIEFGYKEILDFETEQSIVLNLQLTLRGDKTFFVSGI